jgi:hypothetical protein
MTTTPKQPDPYEEPLAHFGKAALFVPLIIGGAVVASIIMLWGAHAREAHLAVLSRNEITAKSHLREAWLDMRARRPEAALEKTALASECIETLNSSRAGELREDYAELRAGLLLLEAESLVMRDCAANAPEAEAKFGEALSLMEFASGELWEAGLFGRARARYEQAKYAEAAADLDQIMTRNANYGAAYYWRSLAREKLGDSAGAAADGRIARRLDSWPPMRDFMQASAVWTRDILSKPDPVD